MSSLSKTISDTLSTVRMPGYLPTFSCSKGVKKNISEVACTILPIISPQTGKFIAAGSAGIHLVESLYNRNVWQVLKSGSELAGNYFHLKGGVIIHTSLAFLENCKGILVGKNDDKRVFKILFALSNLLYLSTMLPNVHRTTATYATLASLYFETFLNILMTSREAYRVLTKSEPKNPFSIFSKATLTVARAYQAYTIIQKMQRVVWVLMMRGGHHKTDGHHTDQLTDKGREQLKSAATHIAPLCADVRATKIKYIGSTQLTSQDGIKLLQELVPVPSIETIFDPELRERTKTPAQYAPREDQRKAREGLTELELFERKPEPTHPQSESGRDMYNRYIAALDRNVSTARRTLNLFLVHATSLQNMFKGLGLEGDHEEHDVPANLYSDHHYSECTGVLLKIRNGAVKALCRLDLYKTLEEGGTAESRFYRYKVYTIEKSKTSAPAKIEAS